MIGLPAGVKVFLACGRTDMRKGMDGLAMQVQECWSRTRFRGHVFCFRGRRGDLLKALYWDTQGLCLFCSPSAWRKAGSSGLRRPTGWCG